MEVDSSTYFQSSFCDCLDYACNCKHLICISLFIQRHMPDSRKELHVIDDALEMCGQDANANFEGGHDESIFETIVRKIRVRLPYHSFLYVGKRTRMIFKYSCDLFFICFHFFFIFSLFLPFPLH